MKAPLRGTAEQSIGARIFAWLDSKIPVFKFAAKFLVLMVLFYWLSLTQFFNEKFFIPYLNFDATVSGMILKGLDQQMAVTGGIIRSEKFSIVIQRGCDGIEPTWMLVAAVLSFPSSIRQKLPALLFGTFFLLGLNPVRIASLFLAGVYLPNLFLTLHLQLWPIAFIFAAIVIWICWIRWVLGQSKRHDSV